MLFEEIKKYSNGLDKAINKSTHFSNTQFTYYIISEEFLQVINIITEDFDFDIDKP